METFPSRYFVIRNLQNGIKETNFALISLYHQKLINIFLRLKEMLNFFDFHTIISIKHANK
jgi:hypothetical protein